MERAGFRRLGTRKNRLCSILCAATRLSALGLAKSYQYYNSHGTAHSFKGRKVSTHTTGLDGLEVQCSYQSYCTSFPAPPVPLRASVPIRLVPTSLSYPRSLRPPRFGGPQPNLFISVRRQSSK